MPRKNSKIKRTTLDDLARMVKLGFDETPTKAEFGAVQKDVSVVKDDLAILRRDAEAGFTSISHSLKAVHDEIKDLQGMDAEITSLPCPPRPRRAEARSHALTLCVEAPPRAGLFVCVGEAAVAPTHPAKSGSGRLRLLHAEKSLTFCPRMHDQKIRYGLEGAINSCLPREV